MGMKVNGSSGLTFPDDTTMSTGSQAVRAWVNFNGTGTVAIRAAYNVTSITDNGTGDYTVNFTTAMPDANYGFSLSSTYATTTRESVRQVYTYDTNSIRVLTGYSYTSPGAGDVTSASVSIFR